MPSLYEAADQAFANSQELQRALLGEHIVAPRPSSLALVGANLLFTLGAGLEIGARPPHLGGLPVAQVVPYIYGALWLVVLSYVLPTLAVLGGGPQAHCTVTWIAVGYNIAAFVGAVLSVLVFKSDVVTRAAACLGVVCFCGGMLLVRSPSYALFAAFMRAKRSLRQQLLARRREVLGRSGRGRSERR